MRKMIPFLLICSIFILNGCGKCEPVPCSPMKCEFPRLPTYRVPASKKLTVQPIDANRSAIKNNDLVELVANNAKLRRACRNYAAVAKKVNEEYQ